MKRSFKFRIYPNKTQKRIIDRNLAFCGFLHNAALQERRDYYERFGKGIGFAAQCAALPEIKEVFEEETSTIHSQSLQQVLKKLDQSFKNFFRRIKNGETPGYPRFKPSNQYGSLVFPQANKNYGIKLLDNKKLRIFGLPGEVRVKWHREWQGEIKQAIIKRQGRDEYYLILSCDNVPEKPLPKTGKTVAIDLGISFFITTDQGEKVNHPRALKEAQASLARLNQSLARKKKGSNNRKKVIGQIASFHQYIHNIREDFQHKTSLNLIRGYDTIIVEDLDIASMIRKEKPKKKPREGEEKLRLEAKRFEPKPKKGNIVDASWGSFVFKLAYKAENTGKQVIKVNPKNTSKTCSSCGHIKTGEEQTLADRVYHCEECNLTMDRDQNAAINIMRIGLLAQSEKEQGLGTSPAMILEETKRSPTMIISEASIL